MVPPVSGTQIPFKNPTTREIRPAEKPAEEMDSIATPATATAGEKQVKPKKAAKDLMAEEPPGRV
jgi:hypothetical protein